MDVSGTLTMSPNKDKFVADFFSALMGPMDTSNQMQVAITSFSDEAVNNLPMGHYNTLEVWDAVDSVAWVGGNTNITGGVQVGASQMNTNDDVNDVLIIISDGFDSFSMTDAVSTASNAVGDGITIISIAFGANNFYSLFTMSQLANMDTPNVFTAGSNDALMGQTDDIIGQMCSLTQSGRLTADPDEKLKQQNQQLYKVVGILLDLYGEPPAWATGLEF